MIEVASKELQVVPWRFEHTATIAGHQRAILEALCQHYKVPIPANRRGITKIKNARDFIPWVAKRLLSRRRSVAVNEIQAALERAVLRHEGPNGIQRDWYFQIEPIAKQLLQELKLDYRIDGAALRACRVMGNMMEWAISLLRIEGHPIKGDWCYWCHKGGHQYCRRQVDERF